MKTTKTRADAIIIFLTAIIGLLFIGSIFIEEKVANCNADLLQFDLNEIDIALELIQSKMQWYTDIILERYNQTEFDVILMQQDDLSIFNGKLMDKETNIGTYIQNNKSRWATFYSEVKSRI